MGKISRGEFRFLKHDNLGASGAEQDKEYLSECFYDSGDLDVLIDCTDFRRIVFGRTGTGKTALLLKLKEREDHSVWLNPDHLSLQYLSNSTILRYLTDLGVNLDLFYRLLWRHILAVELIRVRFRVNTEAAKKSFLQRVYDTFKGDKAKEKAIDYLVQWGESFWKDTEYRIREVTEKFEADIKSQLGVNAQFLNGSVEGQNKASKEERSEIIQRAQEVVNAVQIAQLAKVIELLGDEFLSQPQPRCYLIIDRLDENWVDDALRYRLIRALIETTKDLASIKSAKVIIALRRDLLERVIRLTRDAGFQEEKYESLYLSLQWTSQQLKDLIDERINRLVRRRYTKARVRWNDLLPARVDGQPTDKYILERTMFRPRDIILFFNCCIDQSVGSPAITAKRLRDAESDYSRRRFRSLGDEWSADYPELLDLAKVLKQGPVTFKVHALPATAIQDACLLIAATENRPRGEITTWATHVINDRMTIEEFRQRMLSVFYNVGLVGLKIEPTKPISWSFRGQPTIHRTEIHDTCTVAVCPVFYRCLGVNPR